MCGCQVDPLVSLMKVEKVPDSTYDMVGGLDQQIKEIKEVRCESRLRSACQRSSYAGNVLMSLPGTAHHCCVAHVPMHLSFGGCIAELWPASAGSASLVGCCFRWLILQLPYHEAGTVTYPDKACLTGSWHQHAVADAKTLHPAIALQAAS